MAKKQVSQLKKELEKDDIEFLALKEILRAIIRDIDEWKVKQIKKGSQGY